MARPLRLTFENAFYHLTARGIRKDKIFYSDRDKKVFLNKMNETFNKYSFVCYVYCLMDNHYHLFIKTPFANISKGMHYLNTSYANYFRAKHNLSGAVFQGRYKSILVDADSYAIVLSAYIHLNPLRAKVVERLEDYPFSSYLSYIGKREPIIKNLDTSFILNQFSNDLESARKKYRRYVIENSNLKNPLKKSYKNIALGSDSFIEEIKKKIKQIGKNREIPQTNIQEVLVDKDEIIKVISECFNIKEDEIFKNQKGNIYRQASIYLIKKYTAMPIREIGGVFGLDYTTISVTAKRFEKKLKKDKGISEMVERIEKEIEKLKDG